MLAPVKLTLAATCHHHYHYHYHCHHYHDLPHLPALGPGVSALLQEDLVPVLGDAERGGEAAHGAGRGAGVLVLAEAGVYDDVRGDARPQCLLRAAPARVQQLVF